MSIKSVVLFVLLYDFTSFTSDVDTNHKAHNYIFNISCEILTASQSHPEASVIKCIKRNPYYIMKFSSDVCIFFLKALCIADLH